MNRATKRLLAKQEAAAERERARSAPLTKPGGAGGGRGGRFGGRNGGPPGPGGRGRRFGRAEGTGEEREGRLKRFRRFLKEVRQELKKVAWPSRGEVVTYTIVVLVSVTFVTALVFGLDNAFGRAVLTVFSDSG